MQEWTLVSLLCRPGYGRGLCWTTNQRTRRCITLECG